MYFSPTCVFKIKLIKFWKCILFPVYKKKKKKKKKKKRKELQFDTGEQRHLNEQLLKSSQGSTVPYIVVLANLSYP